MDVLNIGNMFSLESDSLDNVSVESYSNDTPISINTTPYTRDTLEISISSNRLSDLLNLRQSLEDNNGIDRQLGKRLLELAPNSPFKTEKYFTRHVSLTNYNNALESLSEAIETTIEDRVQEGRLAIDNYLGNNGYNKLKTAIKQEHDQFRNVINLAKDLNTSKEDDYSDYSLLNIDTGVIKNTIAKTLESKDSSGLRDDVVVDTPIAVATDILNSKDIYSDLDSLTDYIYKTLEDIKESIDNVTKESIYLIDVIGYIGHVISAIYTVLNNRKQLHTLIFNQYNNQ